ncbi:MAG TPA: RdgB/HAM1 family non-canonical purine NTP pyrophosphatase [Alcanivoracaceae bacterium]|nr:RdgB/HAM1 family non-canonical purine NTP pyrophosphatase [Alcanivoracaceae bacterium]
MKIVLASGNKKKMRELEDILAPLGYNILPQSNFAVSEAEETGLTFVENAILKARNACAHTGLPAISDDSGLEVDILKGAPGIYSARYAGPNATDADNNAHLVAQLRPFGEGPFTARYQCVIVYMQHEADPVPLICQGSWEGEIRLTASGTQGFGYDPHFYVPEKGCTAAELEQDIKHQLSHRGVALRKLMDAFKR